MSLPDLSERAKGFEPLASNVVYLAEYGDSDGAASMANALFQQVRLLSTLTPTEALLIAGCPDARLAVDEARELDIAKVVEDYWKADRAEYIERNMLGALERLVNLLQRIDQGLSKLGIPRPTRPQWVLQGLDFPPGDGVARHVQRTTIDTNEWDIAKERADAFLRYAADLPYELRSGEVDLDAFEDRIVAAVGLPE